jgi:murein endopeptidase
MNRQYGTPDTVGTIVDIAQAWFRNTRYQIGVGDMSFRDGAMMPPHQSHKDGRCVDVRPLRSDKLNAPVSISFPQYDRAATALLVASLLAHRNVLKILFNDRNIKGVTTWPGHDNHLHIHMKS